MLPLFAFLKYTLEAPKNKKYSELNIRGAGEKLVELKHINRNVIKGCFAGTQTVVFMFILFKKWRIIGAHLRKVN